MGYKQKITDRQRRNGIRLFKLYIDKYFHGDPDNWNTRKEPYIFYKHILRQYLVQQIGIVERVRDIEQSVTGIRPDQSTVYNSRDIDINTFKLSKKDLKEILIFLNKHFNVSVQQKIKTIVLDRLYGGYTKEDVSRHCMVHPQVINDLLNNVTLPEPIITQMNREL